MPVPSESEPNKPFNFESIESKLEGLRPDQRNTFWRLYSASQNRLKPQERELRRVLRQIFKDAADDIVSDINQAFQMVGEDKWDLRIMRRLQRDQTLFRQLNDRIRALGGRVDEDMERYLLDAYKRSWTENAYRLDNLTPESINIRFGMINDEAILSMLHNEEFGVDFSDRLGLITDEMTDKIKNSLLRSMVNQETWNQAARRIRTEMGTQGRGAMWRAEMIARTELTRAQEMATMQFNKDNEEFIEKVVWMAHPGACEVCRDLNGTEIVDEEDYPPNQSHPNCTCDSVAIPKGWDDLAGPGEMDIPVRAIGFDKWVEQSGLPPDMRNQ